MKNRPEIKATLGHIANQVIGKPMMITPYQLDVIAHAIRERIGLSTVDRISSEVLDSREQFATSGQAYKQRRHEKIFHDHDGCAVIPIDGTLVHRFGYLDPMCGITGYDGISDKLEAASNDREIKRVWLDLNSPGGSTTGLFALVRKIQAMSRRNGGERPIAAFINEQACSAAYAIASVCDVIYGPPELITGSIGCVLMHFDATQALDKAGIVPTIIRSGDQKCRGTEYEVLDETTQNRLQELVNNTARQFARVVAESRGLSEETVWKTQGDFMTGPEALNGNYVDMLMDEEDAWAEFKAMAPQ